MNEEEKKAYLEQYKRAKEQGVPFFPDIIFKDAVVALLIFLILIALSYFLGAPLEARADPADTSYTPRPEWYFLFIFQLLKYFPGPLEVIGVVVIPTLGILLLFALPFLDWSPRRHFLTRPVVSAIFSLVVVGAVGLTFQALREAPPPAEAAIGDPIAALYARNCAPCHGPSIDVPPGTNLHEVIAQGKHEGMPAWSADLSTDQIDTLAGFILSPAGSRVFAQNCSACHEVSELVASDPLELKQALEAGPAYPSHEGLDVPAWNEIMGPEERTALLNFLVAPDGQRLFAINCSPCHGGSVGFSGDEEALRAIISQGGMHLEMPPWREKLAASELETLARYVVDPNQAPEGTSLFQQYCSDCHGERVPAVEDLEQAREAIAMGGGHETMPVWGEVLTSQQIDALTSYTLESTRGTPLALGQQLFTTNCAPCHGDFGEGGPNPTRPGDIILPISSAEFLRTRDDFTLRAIISEGQPNFGMSPFSTAAGGPLEDDEIDAIVAYIRSWQENPPVELPPEVAATPISISGPEIYNEVCAQCHGEAGEGSLGPALNNAAFQSKYTDEELFEVINLGHSATPMIAWGEILSSEQIQQLVTYLRTFGEQQPAGEATTPSFSANVLPLLQQQCGACHGAAGGWDASSYQSVMTSGNHAPVIIPGDVDGSLLAQKIQGLQSQGAQMPPAGLMADSDIQTVLNWIESGAPEN